MTDRIAALEAEIRDLRRQMRGVPSRWAGGAGASSVLVARIIGGNTIDPLATAGIKYRTTVFTSEASAIDPYANRSLQDGLGYGYLYIDGVQQFTDLGAGPVAQRVLVSGRNAWCVCAVIIHEYVRLGPTETIPGTGANTAYTITGY